VTTWSQRAEPIDVIHNRCPWPHHLRQCKALITLTERMLTEESSACPTPILRRISTLMRRTLALALSLSPALLAAPSLRHQGWAADSAAHRPGSRHRACTTFRPLSNCQSTYFFSRWGWGGTPPWGPRPAQPRGVSRELDRGVLDFKPPCRIASLSRESSKIREPPNHHSPGAEVNFT